MTAADKKTVVPSPFEVKQAAISARKISELTSKSRKKTEFVLTDNKGTNIELSEAAIQVLSRALEEMAKGNSVVLMPMETEVGTQQAADILNVSRPFLVSLLDSGKIPFRLVGRYRRILNQDLLNYQNSRKQGRQRTMDALVKQAQELDMGY